MRLTNVHRLTIMSGIVFAGVGTQAPLMSLYLGSLGASLTTISLILTSFSATMMLSNYFWGRLSDRVRTRKPFLVFGLIGLVVTFTFLSRVPNPAWAWAIRLVEGICMAAYSTASLALMGDFLASSEKRGRRMGIFRGLGSLGFATGAAFIGGPLSDRFSLSVAIQAVAVCFLIATLITLTIQEVPSQESEAESDSDQTTVKPTSPGDRLPTLFLGGVLLWTAALSASVSMWPIYLSNLGYSKTIIGRLWGMAAITEGFVMPVVGNLSDLFGRIPLLMAGGFGIGLVMLGYIFLARFLPALVGVQVARGIGYASYMATAMTFTAEWGDKRVRGNNSGVYNSVSGSGLLVGSLISGRLVELTSFQFLFGVCGASALLSMFCFWLLRLQQSKMALAEVSQ